MKRTLNKTEIPARDRTVRKISRSRIVEEIIKDARLRPQAYLSSLNAGRGGE